MPRKKKEKKETTQTSRTATQVEVGLDETTIKRSEKIVSELSYVTPYMLSQKLGSSISMARKALRFLAEKGVVKLYSPGKRDPIYIPIKKTQRKK